MFVLPATKSLIQGSLVIPHDGKFIDVDISGPSFTVPGTFVIGDWTLTNPVTDGDLLVTITTLPTSSDTIELVEYRVDGGAWVSSGGIVTFTISGLTNTVQVSVELRATNRHGESTAGDLKNGTPTAV